MAIELKPAQATLNELKLIYRGDQKLQLADYAYEDIAAGAQRSVSYTHLTLPTKA